MIYFTALVGFLEGKAHIEKGYDYPKDFNIELFSEREKYLFVATKTIDPTKRFGFDLDSTRKNTNEIYIY